ncbi:hypothetical protein JTB14_008432 [Gonioctena quinquepunctata]|nr:hypothetical protein JTB14_008432 [Gonioctena quinquepunctata]
MTFEIYEGERKNTTFNNKLGEIVLTGIPRKRAGQLIVTFNLDEDGILTVTATEESTGNCNKLVVTMGEFRLSERKIRLSVEEAAEHKHEDDSFVASRKVWQKLKKKCYHILYDLRKILPDSDRDILRNKCQEFLDFSENLDVTKIEVEKKFNSCHESISHILQKNRM